MKVHIIRNIFGLGAWICFFYAVAHMRLNLVTSITFTGPLISTLMAAVVLKEKLYRHRVIGLFVGFCGMLIILRPDAGAFNIYGLCVFAGVVLFSFALLFFHILNMTEKQSVIVFYMTFLSTVMTLPFGIYYWQTPPLINVFWIYMVAVLAVFNMYALVTALKKATIGTLMPYDFLRLIVTAILAYFLFDEDLKLLTVVGAAIIVGSAYYVVRHENRQNSQRLADN